MNIVVDLRRIRIQEKISQDSIARSLGWDSQSGVSMLESGKRSPTLATLTVWADALGYEVVLRPKQ